MVTIQQGETLGVDYTVENTEAQQTQDIRLLTDAPYPIPSSGVSRWTFDDADTDSGTAIDSWGTNDGTINGATTGVSGANQTYTTAEAYSFDGTDDYVEISRPFDEITTASFSLWGKTTDSNKPFIQQRDATSADGFTVRTDGGNARMYLEDDGTFPDVTSSTSVDDDNWYHLVGTISTSELNLYVDGTNEDTSSHSGTYTFNDVWAIGAWWDHEDSIKNHLNGEVDDVRIYDKELTDTEVSNLYNNGSIS